MAENTTPSGTLEERVYDTTGSLTNNISNIDNNTTAAFNAGLRLGRKSIVLNLLRRNNDEKNMTQKEIANIAGISVGTVNKISQMLEKKRSLTTDNLIEQKRGRKPDLFSVISEDIYKSLITAMRDGPHKYNLHYSSWSAKCIREYLLKEFNLDVKVRYIYKFLSRVNCTSKFASRTNPLKDEDEIEFFEFTTFNKLYNYALDNNMIIFFCDESHVKKSYHQRGYAPIGERSSVSFSTNLEHSPNSFVTFLSPDGCIKIFNKEGHINSDVFISILKELKKEYPGRKILVVLDNHRMHKSKKTNSWLNHHNGGRDIFEFAFLPKYAPEINPVEYVNNFLKQELRKNSDLTVGDVVRSAQKICDYLNRNDEETRKLCMSFFNEKHCSYIKKAMKERTG